jgi:hypothetical protein
MFHDCVRILDAGVMRLRSLMGEIVASREWRAEKSVVEVHGWVKMLMRERGKIVPGSHREGSNVWTNTGREYLAQAMSLKTAPTTAFRSDLVTHIGVGTGASVEEPGVTQLAVPKAYDIGLYLAPLDTPTFPLAPTLTTVRFHRTYSETEITIDTTEEMVSEAGLFTNGSPTQNYAPTTRDLTIQNASLQAPVAYKAVEPLGKRNSMQLEVYWEIRF